MSPSRLQLVPGRASSTAAFVRHTTPLTLWHLLSLDASTVAALWLVFAGWCAGVHLSALDPLAMFLAVWMLYAADRLLDARPLDSPFSAGLATDLEERHRFHHAHRNLFLPCIAAGTLPLAFLLHRLAGPVLHLYALLVSLLAGWLLLVHAQPVPSAGTRRLPKECAVGIFFSAAVYIPTVARAPALRLALLPSAILFAGVCTLNCLFLYAWEHPLDSSRAHATTRWALRRLRPLAVLWMFASVTDAVMAAKRHGGLWIFRLGPGTVPHPVAIPIACGLSAALLLGLDGQRHRMPALQLRAFADVTLLSPLLPLLIALLTSKPDVIR